MAVGDNGVFETQQLSDFLEEAALEALTKLKVTRVTSNKGNTVFYFRVGKEWRNIVLDGAAGFRPALRNAVRDYLFLYGQE